MHAWSLSSEVSGIDLSGGASLLAFELGWGWECWECLECRGCLLDGTLKYRCSLLLLMSAVLLKVEGLKLLTSVVLHLLYIFMN